MNGETSTAYTIVNIWGFDDVPNQNKQLGEIVEPYAPQFSSDMVSMFGRFGAVLDRHLDEVRNMLGNALPSKVASESRKLVTDTDAVRSEPTTKLGGIAEQSAKENDEQWKRILRPLLVPNLVNEKPDRWDKWEGVFRIENIGNGSAIQPVIRVRTHPVTHNSMDREKTVFEKRLMYVKDGDDSGQIIISVPLPISARSLVTQHPVRLSYILELYWRSIYEKGYAKSELPFYLLLDRSGIPRIRMRMLKIDWHAALYTDSSN